LGMVFRRVFARARTEKAKEDGRDDDPTLVETTLLLGSGADIAAAILFAFTGRQIAMRRVSASAKLPQTALMTWWLSIAAIWLIDGLRGLAVAVVGVPGQTVQNAFFALFYVNVLLLCLGLWGLLTYLIFIYRGSQAAIPLAGFYATYFGIAAVAVAYARPDAIRVGEWATHVTYRTPLPGAIEASLLLALLLPQLVGAAAYLSLAPRTKDPLQRYRVVVVGVTLLIWIGVNLAADLARLSYDDTWQAARRVLGIAAASAILAAYAPPRWLRRRVTAHAEAPA